jgi:hypothetical protein
MLAGLAEHLAKTQLDLRAPLNQVLAILASQGREELIFRRGPRRL